MQKTVENSGEQKEMDKHKVLDMEKKRKWLHFKGSGGNGEN